MRVVPQETIEVLNDPTDADAAKKAKRRMDLCVASSEEQMLYRYDPNGARRNENPGIPCDDYGTMTSD